MSIEITVHHFTKSNGDIPTDVIESARALVQAVTLDSTIWHSGHAPVPRYYESKNNSFLWTPAPPKVQPKSNTCSLHDWDLSPPSSPMSFCSPSIIEFESTDLSGIFQSASCRKYVSSIPSRRFGVDLDTNSNVVSYKRPRLHVEATEGVPFSIFRTIPLPHYLDVPFPDRPLPKGITQIPDFPIARCLVPSIFIRPRYIRTAWVIPLRGSSSVDGTSTAQPCANPLKPCSNTILWTKPALSQFWSFLSQQRVNHNFGPLSFGYIYPSNTGKLKITDQTEMSGLMEYIKVYHDAQFAMKIRSSLDSFRWNDPSLSHAGSTTFHRIFRGKQLLLVDEACRPILLA